MGPRWGQAGPRWGQVGPKLAQVGPKLGSRWYLVAMLLSSRRHLGVLARLEPILEAIWPNLICLGAVWGRLGRQEAVTRARVGPA